MPVHTEPLIKKPVYRKESGHKLTDRQAKVILCQCSKPDTKTPYRRELLDREQALADEKAGH